MWLEKWGVWEVRCLGESFELLKDDTPNLRKMPCATTDRGEEGLNQ